MSDDVEATKTPALPGLLSFVARIISAHAENNEVAPEALPGLITSVYKALQGAGGAPAAPPTATPARPEPAVNSKKSVFPDYLVCLEDGKHLKTLKRHLLADHDLTPAAYRERWGLADDYPMTAQSYATRRSELAREAGLGRKTKPEPEAAPLSHLNVKRIPEGVSGKKRSRPIKRA